jgi:RNA polymerase sigma-70 factor (ECF subfamily)
VSPSRNGFAEEDGTCHATPAPYPPWRSAPSSNTLASSDVELTARARQGDRGAFGALIDGRIPRLYATASLILRNTERAEDAVQDALVEAWRDIRGLRDPARLDAWLHRLVVRACYRASRRDRRRRTVELPLAFDHDAPAAADIDGVVTRDTLERAFARIPLDQRTILVLAYYADLSLADVATALDVPLGTVKSRLSRATDSFRAALAADDRASKPPARAGR